MSLFAALFADRLHFALFYLFFTSKQKENISLTNRKLVNISNFLMTFFAQSPF